MTDSSAHRPRSAAVLGSEALGRLADAGLLRVGVPASMGGDGRTTAPVAEAARALLARDPAAAWIYRAQRLAIELLVQADNVGLREHLLPQLLCGERAGTLPLSIPARPLLAIESGPAMRLFGQYERLVNLQWAGFSLAAPVQRGDDVQWVVLRGEEDGLRAGIDHGEPCPAGSRAATVTIDGVFFRMDEWLGSAALAQRIAPLAAALSGAVPMPAV